MEKNKNISVFTVCNVAYLNKALVLAKTLAQESNIKLDIFVFDKERQLNVDLKICNIHWIENQNIPGFKKLSFKYNVIELTTALKPLLALKLLENSSKVVFFDPDVMIFKSIECILKKLDSHPVLVTPHYFSPKENNDLIDDHSLMKFGQFNLGFFAANSSDQSKTFLNWWSDRCLSDGFINTQEGIFVDQKWVSIASIFFPYIYVDFHPGYNVAFWNIDDRVITKTIDNIYRVNKNHDLIFFHFSAVDKSNPRHLSKRIYEIGKNDYQMLESLSMMYHEELKKYKNFSNNLEYSYDHMSDGRYITPSLRLAFAACQADFKDIDPFDSCGPVGLFAKKNYLFQRNNDSYVTEGYSDLGKHTMKINIVFFLMRIILRLIGPNQFMNLSRFMVYISSYHKIKGFWKN